MVKDKEYWESIQEGGKTWASNTQNLQIYLYVEEHHKSGTWVDYNFDWKCATVKQEYIGHDSSSHADICYNVHDLKEHTCTTFFHDGTTADCMHELYDHRLWLAIE
jgi:hypothetical protein